MDKHQRARRAGAAAAASPLRYCPLQEVVNESGDYEELACGHTMRRRRDLVGATYAYRRRCRECGREACEAQEHRLTIQRGAHWSCLCGAADGAWAHVALFHGIDVPEPLHEVTLAALQQLHTEAHDGPRLVGHWHWAGDEWGVRTRPHP